MNFKGNKNANKTQEIPSYIAVILSFFNIAFAKEPIKWSYTGKTGPDKWSEVSKEFLSCKEGVIQSPINLNKIELGSNKELIIFDYNQYEAALKGFTIKVYNEPVKYIRIGEKKYTLAQFRLHALGEHSIDG